MSPRRLERFVYLSLAAAVATIVLKLVAAAVTGSVGFLSDALESVVNLVAALVALVALRVAARPPDAGHPFGHGQAEYISAAVEGGMIFVVAAGIVYSAVRRFVHPVEVDSVLLGASISAVAALINFGAGRQLLRAGRRYRSIALVADGRHLLADVATSVGVLVGVGLVSTTGWRWLDPAVALAVGVNILGAGYVLVRRSVIGLLNASLPAEDLAKINAVLSDCRGTCGVDFHALLTRESGRQRFVYLHMLVPPAWTVTQAHDLSDELVDEIAGVIPGARTFVHIEPIGDPASYDHEGLP